MVGWRKETTSGVVCALRIRKRPSGGVSIRDRGGVDVDRYGSQLIGLNLLISVTVWVESW